MKFSRIVQSIVLFACLSTFTGCSSEGVSCLAGKIVEESANQGNITSLNAVHVPVPAAYWVIVIDGNMGYWVKTTKARYDALKIGSFARFWFPTSSTAPYPPE